MHKSTIWGLEKVSFVEKLCLYLRGSTIGDFTVSSYLPLRLTEDDVKPDSILSLTYVKFQNVQSLTVSIVTFNVIRQQLLFYFRLSTVEC